MKRYGQWLLLVSIISSVVVSVVPGHTTPLALAAQVTGWRQVMTEIAPSPRHDHILVAAGEQGRLVLFGGRSASEGILGDTWVFEVSIGAWREITTPTAPAARFGAAAAWDAARERVLLFAGQAQGLFNDVWAFEMATETWSQLDAQGELPAERYGTSAVVAAGTDTLLISHGFAAGRFDDTFALDLATNEWRDVSPAKRPLKRCLHEAAFSAGTGQMILFGGCSSGAGPCPQGDTWRYDLAVGAWTEITSASPSTSPAARSNPALVADGGGMLWLFGGRGAGGAFYNDLWMLDAVTGTWQQAPPVDDTPAPRSSHDAAWDAVSQQIVLFGGLSAAGDLNDLWVYRQP